MIPSRIPVLLAAAALLAPGCGKKAAPVQVVERKVLMGTEVTVTAWDAALTEEELRTAVASAFERMEQMEALLSRHRDDSELSRVNAGAGGGPVKVSADLLAALSRARHAYETSKGAFDPTVNPLIRLWIEAAKADRLPSDEEIAAERQRVGFDRVAIDAAAATVDLPEGMSMDLGGIAKGFIVDEACAAMRKRGLKNGIVEAGGDLFAFGTRMDGGSWKIGIQDPGAGEEVDEAKLACVLKVSGKGVTTSGHYRRFSTIQGRKFSHIIDPRTGRPVTQRVLSASVMAPDAATADGLSTAIAVLGHEEGLKLVESMDGVEALLLVDEKGAVKPLESSGLKAFKE